MRPLRFLDTGERTYDSCLPELSTMLNIEQVPSNYTYLGDNVPAFVEPDDDYWMAERLITNSIITQFPFASNPGRRVEVPIGILSASSTDEYAGFNIASSPTNVTGIELDPLTDIFKVRNSLFSTAPYNNRYDINSPPNYLVGSNEPIDLTANLVSYYRPTQLISTPIGNLENLVSNPGVGTDLIGLTGTGAGGPGRDDGSPLFPKTGTFTVGVGATASFPETSSGGSVGLLVASADADDHKMTEAGSDVSFSISVTFKLSEIGTSNQVLISRRRGNNSPGGDKNFEYSVHVDPNGAIVFRKGRNITAYLEAKTANNVVSTGEWYNVTVTFKSPDVAFGIASMNYRVYVNGVSKTCGFTETAAAADATPSIDSRLRIGADIDPTTGTGFPSYTAPTPNPLSEIRNGNIHSVAIWKGRALSAADVSDLYNLELVGSAVGDLRHRVGRNTLGIEKSAAFRYGISNVEPEFSSVILNPNHHGYVRDIFEPRRLTATADGFKPVKVRFMSGSAIIVDPANTHSQNLDTAVTSSLPFFDDGITRNRDDNPDEVLLSV